MKKTILVITTLILITVSAFADDGGTRKPEDWTYGNIYVTEPNDKISLERELLVVEQTAVGTWGYDKNNNWDFNKKLGKGVTALFDFKNTTNALVTVPCAFPVVVQTQIAVTPEGTLTAYIPVFPYGHADEAVLAVAFGKSVVEGLPKADLIALDKKLRTISAQQYRTELSRVEEKHTELEPISIIQDGKAVQVLTVGIETSIEKDLEATSYLAQNKNREGAEVYTLTLVMHFYHELTFAPSAHSKLSVSYDIDSMKQAHRGTRYELTYDISTGGTWKGALKSFVVLTDGKMTAEHSNTDFEQTNLGELSTNASNFNLYTAENYKPQKGENLVFKALEPYRESYNFLIDRTSGPQSFVKNIRSSSAYKGSYKIAGNTYNDEKNADSNLRTSGYGAETSFDGILFNGWVEDVKGDGIGEWIEFTLTKAVFGPFAANGLARFDGRIYDDYGHNWGNDSRDYTILTKAGEYVGATWEANNRVKTITLSSSALKKDATLDFGDFFPATCTEYSPQWISVNAVKNPLLLVPGTYRMTIKDVYKGAKYDDTALGEVWFLPLSDLAAKILTTDSDGFYTPPLVRIVQDYSAWYVDKLFEYQDKYDILK